MSTGPNPDKGTYLGKFACPVCGTVNKVEAMRNGKGWFYCAAPDDDGEPCGTRVQFGRAASQQMYRAQIEQRQDRAKQAKAETDDRDRRRAVPVRDEPQKDRDRGTDALDLYG